MGLNSILKKIFGDQSERAVRPLWQRLEKEINPISEEIKDLSHDELRARIDTIRDSIRGEAKEYQDKMTEIRTELETLEYDKREPYWKKIDELREEKFKMYARRLDEVLPEVFAVVKETARRFAGNETIEVTATAADRELAAAGKDFVTIDGDKAIYNNSWVAGGNKMTWDMVHYDVQLIGGMVLHGIMNGDKASNNIAEMATGEGKTLVATLPVFLNALTGEGVHVVTVNDYLAKRDSEWMGPLYQFHGLTVDCIDKTEPNSEERRKAYRCDITFGTNNTGAACCYNNDICFTCYRRHIYSSCVADRNSCVLFNQHHCCRFTNNKASSDYYCLFACAVDSVMIKDFHTSLWCTWRETNLLACKYTGHGKVCHTVNVFFRSKCILDHCLIQMFWKRTE